LGCGGENLVLPTDEAPVAGAPAHLEMESGHDQIGRAGSPLPKPLVVRLVDQSGTGIPNQPVTWVVNTGGGTATPEADTTDEEGFASATWTLGSPGPNSLSAIVPGVGFVTFTATANNGGGNEGGGGGTGTVPSASASTVSADPASIQVGTGVSIIRVTVRDAAGAPVPGVSVTLSATGNGNTITQPAGLTGVDGVVIGALSSDVVGTKDVVAIVNGAVQITQTAQVFVAVAPASRIERVEGNNQTAGTGDQVPVSPAVRVTNALGQPVSGIGVTFVVTSGGGTVVGGSQTTNADGIARVGSWTLGAPGRNTLEARASSLSGSPVVFEATATSEQPPAPATEVDRLVFTVQPHDVEVNETFRVEVALVNATGEVVPLSGIFIYLDLFREGKDTPTNTHLKGERFENTEDGVAVFDVQVDTDGEFRLRALTDDLPELGPHGPEPYLFSIPFDVH
jgi:adhesin/invasin